MRFSFFVNNFLEIKLFLVGVLLVNERKVQCFRLYHSRATENAEPRNTKSGEEIGVKHCATFNSSLLLPSIHEVLKRGNFLKIEKKLVKVPVEI